MTTQQDKLYHAHTNGEKMATIRVLPATDKEEHLVDLSDEYYAEIAENGESVRLSGFRTNEDLDASPFEFTFRLGDTVSINYYAHKGVLVEITSTGARIITPEGDNVTISLFLLIFCNMPSEDEPQKTARRTRTTVVHQTKLPPQLKSSAPTPLTHKNFPTFALYDASRSQLRAYYRSLVLDVYGKAYERVMMNELKRAWQDEPEKLSGCRLQVSSLMSYYFGWI